MEGLISTLLIAALSLITGTGIFWFFYRIPLFFHIIFRKTCEKTEIMLVIRWGLIGLRIVPLWEEWMIEVMIGEAGIISKRLPYSGTDQEEKHDTDDTGSDESHNRDLIRFIPVGISFLSDCISHKRVDTVRGEIRYGTGDPVITGWMYGYYHAIRPMISGWCQVTFIPDFTTIRLEGRAEGGIWIETPVQLLIRLVRDILSVVIRMKRGAHA